ncbi:MAG: hypothetical protein JNG83_02050 [Opitutaceae bacterium]|nr:hypothetical protein [Opitutaceae bacterium]
MKEPSAPFSGFLDPVDMVMCCPAGTRLAEVNALAGEQQLRFPLVVDPAATLAEHLAAVEYASASARFGPFVDNVLGMNWRVPCGRLVRIGERVIKSATGYDLNKFLLHSDGRYGNAVDLVLRLRRRGGEAVRCILRGAHPAIERARISLLRSPWIHWIDVVDLVVTAGEPAFLYLAADCGRGDVAAFDDYFRQLSAASGTQLEATEALDYSLPKLSLKTVITAAPPLAGELVREHGGQARVLCASGVVHYLPPRNLPLLPEPTLRRLELQCLEQGGHSYGPWSPRRDAVAQESAWATTLESAWNHL